MAVSGRKKGSGLRSYLPIAAISMAVVAFVGGVVWLTVSSMGDAGKPTKKPIQQVQIIRPPPPPETRPLSMA